jgi:hypothetical protein
VRCICSYFSLYHRHNKVSDKPCITFFDMCLRRFVLSAVMYMNRINVLQVC